jgi:lipid II:glycine glycyltransferase (peptidoglycan interpeptide bridge formation enzyme)
MMSKREFLQSDAWARLQVAAGHEAVGLPDGGHGFVHALPLVGRYLYTPRWPSGQFPISNFQFPNLLADAKKKGYKWVRIEPETEEILVSVRNEIETLRQAQGDNLSVVVAPHDMQPRETFVIDITKSEEELLAAMKPKTRYNIRLAEKKGVRVFATREQKYQEAFLDLITATAERKDIVPHPRGYYEKFFTELPEEMCSLFVAEYEGAVLAANMLIIYGDTATYLHGGSSDRYREAMAPMLLQWEQIRFAKAQSCTKYDFGGIRTGYRGQGIEDSVAEKKGRNSWAGITRFKTGFSPKTVPTVFPGCYDIVLDKAAYRRYDQLRLLRRVAVSIRRFLHI